MATPAFAPPALFIPLPAAMLPLADELSTRTLLLGPPRSGKTSLLMQFAFARARRGLTTLFVCHSREKLWVQRPARPHGADGEDDAQSIAALKRIRIKYVKGGRDLRDLLVSFHLSSEELPHALIIDDLPAILQADGASSSGADTPSPHAPPGCTRHRATPFRSAARRPSDSPPASCPRPSDCAAAYSPQGRS